MPERRPLSDCFAAGCISQEGSFCDDANNVEQALTAGLRVARAAWPEIDISCEAFMAYAAARLGFLSAEQLARVPWSDLYLACGCASAVPSAIAVVESKLLPELDASLRRLRLTPDQVGDLKQGLGLLLFGRQKITEYNGKGPLRAWLRVTAVRAAFKLLRKHGRELPIDDDSALESGVSDDDPEFSYMKELYRPAFRQAFQQALDELSSREKLVLRQYLVDGLTIDDLGRLYRVHRATTARWVANAKDSLLMRTRERFIETAKVTPAECESIFRMVRSRLAATIRRRLEKASSP